ncbi:Ca2+ regulator and membrane fusion Fig1-domain-containing protein [Rutstroemia sp. NJR-2017a WRK4]|nr:Ca2+ regulator and membrane fusion Fig1-domain-containing protein [Rutstroemia sp. NJR-2017a WRK4]
MSTVRRPMRPKNIIIRASIWVLAAIPFYTMAALAIAGSATTTPGVENIFIGQLSKAGTDGDKLGGLRIGYVGLCAFVGNQGANGNTFDNTNGYQCIGKPYSQTPEEIGTTLHVDSDIVELGQKLQTDITIFMPAVALGLFLVGFLVDTFAWLFAGLGKPVGSFGTIAMPFLWASVACSLGAAYTLTVSVNAVKTVLTDKASGCSANMQIEQGKTLEGLQWSCFGFAFIFALAIYMVSRDIMYGFNIMPRNRSRGRRDDVYSDFSDDRDLSY